MAILPLYPMFQVLHRSALLTPQSRFSRSNLARPRTQFLTSLRLVKRPRKYF